MILLSIVDNSVVLIQKPLFSRESHFDPNVVNLFPWIFIDYSLLIISLYFIKFYSLNITLTTFIVIIEISIQLLIFDTISYHLHQCHYHLCFCYLNNNTTVSNYSVILITTKIYRIVILLFHAGFYHETVWVRHKETLI